MNNCINGKALAEEMLKHLSIKVERLRQKKIIPTLAIIQVGKNESSQAYIKQKKKAARKIAARVRLFSFSSRVSFQKLAETIKKLNENPKIHGIIVQRPLPATIATGSFNEAVELSKDVDGAKIKSPFNPPVAEAVLYVLQKIFATNEEKELATILKSKKILLIGRGETAGRPIAKTLTKNKIKFIMAHSKTRSIKDFLSEADIIISCVGKRNVVKKELIKEGIILLGVGICREKNKLYGDYEEEEIQEKASFYTPTPGGIGPLTVAFLMKNLITASQGIIP